MRADTRRRFDELILEIETYKRQLRSDALKGWSISSDALAAKYDVLLCRIYSIMASDRDADTIDEAARKGQR